MASEKPEGIGREVVGKIFIGMGVASIVIGFLVTLVIGGFGSTGAGHGSGFGGPTLVQFVLRNIGYIPLVGFGSIGALQIYAGYRIVRRAREHAR